MKITLDWNCVIEVEERQGQASAIENLVDAHRHHVIEVALLAASASENNRSKRFPGNAKLFIDRVTRLGWDDLPIVLMPGVTGLSYLDYCFYADDSFETEMEAIWLVIAPNVERDPIAHVPPGQLLTDELIQSEALARWRNTWCDVISAYSHIHAKRDVFVTLNTRDFQNNARRLAALGMKTILDPRAAATLIESTQRRS